MTQGEQFKQRRGEPSFASLSSSDGQTQAGLLLAPVGTPWKWDFVLKNDCLMYCTGDFVIELYSNHMRDAAPTLP